MSREIKLSTWNVNGLRSTVRNGFDTWIRQSNFDLVCLQETKMQEDIALPEWFNPYLSYWNSAEKKGYSGVLTLVSPNIEVFSVEKGIGDKALDSEGRVLTIEVEEFFLVNVYAPHSHRMLLRAEAKRRFCELFLTHIKRLKKKKSVVIAGDLNVAYTKDDVENYNQNFGNAGLLDFEIDWFTNLLSLGFFDTFRKYNIQKGNYTWWSMRKGVRERNIGWRLDYILTDVSLFDKVTDCFHSPEQNGSDHCPVIGSYKL